MTYRFTGLDPAPFRHLYGLPEAELAAQGVERRAVDAMPGYPDRIELRDALPGETVLLLNYEHQPAATPYRARHAIFVREGAEQAATVTDAVPDPIRVRLISLRAFDRAGNIVDADVAEGTALEPLILSFLANPAVDYLHAHFAKRGCYAARIDRA